MKRAAADHAVCAGHRRGAAPTTAPAQLGSRVARGQGGLKKNLEDAPAQLEAGAAKVEAAVKAAAAGASPSPDAAKLIDDAKALAQNARSAATATRELQELGPP